MRQKVESDKLVKLEGKTNIQVWHGESKLFNDNLKIKEANLKDGDTIILRQGVEVKVDQTNPIIKQMIEMGYTEDQIRAALFKTQNNHKAALEELINQGKPNNFEDDEYDDAAYEIEKSLEILKIVNPKVHNDVLTNPELHQIFTSRLIDCLNYYQTTASNSEEETNKLLETYVQDFLKYLEELQPIKAMLEQLGKDPQLANTYAQSGLNNQEEFEQEQNYDYGYQNMPQMGVDSSNSTNNQMGLGFGGGNSGELTQADNAAIERLAGFGFDKKLAEQAYLYAGKDENAALDLLFEMQDNKK
ncbi:unnamed protein product [Sphagnum balticum]